MSPTHANTHMRPAVRYWGPEFIAAINAMRMPKFASGGQIGKTSAISRLSFPSLEKSVGASPDQLTPINLNFPEFGQSLKMQGSPNIAKEVEQVFKMMALWFGKR